MTFVHQSPRGCQGGQGWGGKGSGNESQICEALSEGAPVTSSPLSFKAAPHCRDRKGPEPLQGSCGTPWVGDGLCHAVWHFISHVAPGEHHGPCQEPCRWLQNQRVCLHGRAPWHPPSHSAVGPTAGHHRLPGAGGSCCLLDVLQEQWWLPSHRLRPGCAAGAAALLSAPQGSAASQAVYGKWLISMLKITR